MTGTARALVAGITAVLGIVALLLINGSPVVKDSAQNLQMAVDLSHSGTMSDAEQPPYRASMYREPLPVVVSAAVIDAVDALMGPAESAQYFSGSRVEYIKYQNIAWLLSLWLAVFFTARHFTGSMFLPIVAGLLAVKPFLTSSGAQGVNDLYTELPAAVFITCAGYLLVKAVGRGGTRGFVIAGVFYGLLALTKAAMLYVFLGVVLVLLGTYVLRATRRRVRLAHVAALCASALLVVAPWIGRNWLTFHQPQISERGGLVLYTRALMNQVTPTEYRGTFYVWARPAVRPWVGRVLGFTPRDLAMGGRLQRLNDDLGTDIHEHDMRAELAGRPEDAITLHRQARAERVRLEREFEAQGAVYPEVAADSTMSHEAVAIIKGAIGSDLALAVPLMWRCAPLIFPVLVVVLGFALWARRYVLALFVLPGVGLVVFYALATHFEPRPAIVAQSTAVIGVIVLVDALRRALPWWRGRAQALPGSRPGGPIF